MRISPFVHEIEESLLERSLSKRRPQRKGTHEQLSLFG
jgi:hypothetical protein